jgi:hypothetical protein
VLLLDGANQPDVGPDAKPVKGLRIDLSADKKTARVGENVLFTAILTNVSDQEMNVELASRVLGSTANPFETGMFLRRVPEPAHLMASDVELPPRSPTSGAYVGPVFPPEIRVIAPCESLIYQSALTLQSNNGQMSFPIGTNPPSPLEIPSGVNRFRIVYESDNKCITAWNQEFQQRFAFQQQQKAMEAGRLVQSLEPSANTAQVKVKPMEGPRTLPTCWEGTVRSNDVLIHILRR